MGGGVGDWDINAKASPSKVAASAGDKLGKKKVKKIVWTNLFPTEDEYILENIFPDQTVSYTFINKQASKLGWDTIFHFPMDALKKYIKDFKGSCPKLWSDFLVFLHLSSFYC